MCIRDSVAAAIAQHSLHPVSRALVLANEHMSKASADFSITSVQEVSGFGLVADSSLGQLKLGSAKFCGLESDLSQPFSEDSDLNTSKVYLVSEKGWLASFEIIEAIKEDAVLAIKALQKNGLHVEVLSGDKRQSVERIAKLVGIIKVQGSCTPQDKLNHMQQLQQQGHHVAMVGDGLNDGPVLALSLIHIFAVRETDGVILEVRDTGPGIPALEREQVQQRFYRIAGSGEEGSGLGLSIVQRIAELHGAKLEFHDNTVENGLLVKVIWPPK